MDSDSRHGPGLLLRESDFQEWLRQLSATFGYLYYHTHRAAHSPAGFPDTFMVRLEPKPRLIFAELKTDDMLNSQPSIDQWVWLRILQRLGGLVECYMWRPTDRDQIEEILK